MIGFILKGLVIIMFCGLLIGLDRFFIKLESWKNDKFAALMGWFIGCLLIFMAILIGYLGFMEM